MRFCGLLGTGQTAMFSWRACFKRIPYAVKFAIIDFATAISGGKRVHLSGQKAETHRGWSNRVDDCNNYQTIWSSNCCGFLQLQPLKPPGSSKMSWLSTFNHWSLRVLNSAPVHPPLESVISKYGSCRAATPLILIFLMLMTSPLLYHSQSWIPCSWKQTLVIV